MKSLSLFEISRQAAMTNGCK